MFRSATVLMLMFCALPSRASGADITHTYPLPDGSYSLVQGGKTVGLLRSSVVDTTAGKRRVHIGVFFQRTGRTYVFGNATLFKADTGACKANSDPSDWMACVAKNATYFGPHTANDIVGCAEATESEGASNSFCFDPTTPSQTGVGIARVFDAGGTTQHGVFTKAVSVASVAGIPVRTFEQWAGRNMTATPAPGVGAATVFPSTDAESQWKALLSAFGGAVPNLFRVSYQRCTGGVCTFKKESP
ncbi:hypothetical protein L6V77_23925 [Myxococcota bacterium]|jgi:hypothetical protein|nr:hypothetical protein [Myxococcota bacterium]